MRRWRRCKRKLKDKSWMVIMVIMVTIKLGTKKRNTDRVDGHADERRRKGKKRRKHEEEEEEA